MSPTRSSSMRQFSSLNFNYFNAGGGLDYVFENLGQLTASIRYEYQRYLDGDTSQ